MGCSVDQPPQAQDDQPAQPVIVEEQAHEEQGDNDEFEKEVIAASAQAPEPQAMSFTASDGTQLNGTYYPAASANAPLVILMHWALGDQFDYVEIAYWLQNRGLGGISENPGNSPWLDPVWFPVIAADKSYAVFSFTFRECEGGCQDFLREGWLDDAQSAVEFAYNLESVNKEKILIVGASIGADGAVDGCLYLNEQHPNSCKGASSLSAGNYLTLDYSQTIQKLVDYTAPAWCLYDESDAESAAVCGGFEAANYTAYIIPGGHGMSLVRPDLEPNSLELLLDFIYMNIG